MTNPEGYEKNVPDESPSKLGRSCPAPLQNGPGGYDKVAVPGPELQH